MYLNSPFTHFELPVKIIEQARAFRKQKDVGTSFLITVTADTGDPQYKIDFKVYLSFSHGALRAYYNEPQFDPKDLIPVDCDGDRNLWESISDSIVISVTVYICQMYERAAGAVYRHKLKMTFKEAHVIKGKVTQTGPNSYKLQ